MKEFNYIPQPERDEKGKVKKEAVFEGVVVLEVPKYKERLKLVKELNFKVDANGDILASTDQVDAAIRLVEVVEKHVKKVDVVKKETGEKFSNVDDLGYDQDGSELINELGNVILSGIKMGKR